MTHTDDLRERVERASTDLMQDLSALLEEFDLKFDLTKPDRQVRVEQRTINNMFFALLNARAAAGPEESTVYYTATQEVYDVSGVLDTEPKYANSFNVAGGPYETVEDAAENAEEFRWIIGFRGVRPVSIRAASGFEAGEEEEIDCFRPHDLDDFLPEIVDAAIAYRNAIATALAAKQEGGER